MIVRRVLSTAVILSAASWSALASETFQVSWDSSGFDPEFRLHPFQRIAFVQLPPGGFEVVDKASEPASPFNEQSALFIQSSEDEKIWFRLGFRAFEETDVSRGVAEFFIQPEQGTVNIQLGLQSDPWNPETPESYFGETTLFNLSLPPGEEPKVAGRVVETDSIALIEPSQGYRVTIKWDFSGDEPRVRIFLNGEVVRAQGATEPLPTPFSNKEATGINTFRITLGNPENHIGSFFLGPIAAVGGEEIDLESAKEPLVKP